jgi:hypothetical protein
MKDKIEKYVEDPLKETKEFAYSIGDKIYLKNPLIIKQRLLLIASNPKVGRINFKKIGRKIGVNPLVLRHLFKTKVFQSELTGYIRQSILNRDNIINATRAFKEAILAGEKWAVERTLEEAGILSVKGQGGSKSDSDKKSFDSVIINYNAGEEKMKGKKVKTVDLIPDEDGTYKTKED